MAENITQNVDDLLDACYLTFGKRRSSGAVLNAYLDSKGYPTIGCGHLIFTYKNIHQMNDQERREYEAKIADQRKRHVKRMRLLGINPEQAGREFDALYEACQNGTCVTEYRDGVNVIVSPKVTSLTPDQAEKLFRRDNMDDCEAAIRHFPDIHSYPVEVQTCLVHLGSHGSGIANIKNACKGDLSIQNIVKNMCDIRLQEMREWARENPGKENKRTPSINAMCELFYACEAAGIEPPSEVTNAIARHQRDFDHYTKNILGPVRDQYGEPPIVRMKRDRENANRLSVVVGKTLENMVNYETRDPLDTLRDNLLNRNFNNPQR